MDREIPEGRGLIHHADRFPPLPAERASLWADFGRWETIYFPRLVGLALGEVRLDDARMRLPYREVRTAADVLAATASLVYTIGPANPG